MAKEWPIPVVSSHYDKVLILAEKAVAKRGRKAAQPKAAPKKKRKANQAEEEENDERTVKTEVASQEVVPRRPLVFVEKWLFPPCKVLI